MSNCTLAVLKKKIIKSFFNHILHFGPLLCPHSNTGGGGVQFEQLKSVYSIRMLIIHTRYTFRGSNSVVLEKIF